MSYDKLSTAYRIERMKSLFKQLDGGKAVNINHLYLEEIRYLKDLYGSELTKQGGFIYRKMEQEVLF